jgi:hypothetical protein
MSLLLRGAGLSSSSYAVLDFHLVELEAPLITLLTRLGLIKIIQRF